MQTIDYRQLAKNYLFSIWHQAFIVGFSFGFYVNIRKLIDALNIYPVFFSINKYIITTGYTFVPFVIWGLHFMRHVSRSIEQTDVP